MEFRDVKDSHIYLIVKSCFEEIKSCEKTIENKKYIIADFQNQCDHVFENTITDPHTHITTEVCKYCQKIKVI